MMFFARKYRLLDTPLFEGFKDYHNHTLPGVDDGVQLIEESLEVLAHFEELGVRAVVLTPHVMVGVNEGSDDLYAAFHRLRAAYRGHIELTLASEYMLDSNFFSHLDGGELRMLQGRNLLVETSYFSAPYNFNEMLFEVSVADIQPIIAHPERYLYMARSKYHLLHEREYRLQLNLLSLSNLYGSRVRENAIYLLEQGLYSIIGTDLHNLVKFKRAVERIRLSSRHIDMLMALKMNDID
ncbi:MAG: CpsB/CapC family capsule biosynthesis tyrosine phosphatase [Rikenellaceae bacterium]